MKVVFDYTKKYVIIEDGLDRDNESICNLINSLSDRKEWGVVLHPMPILIWWSRQSRKYIDPWNKDDFENEEYQEYKEQKSKYFPISAFFETTDEFFEYIKNIDEK